MSQPNRPTGQSTKPKGSIVVDELIVPISDIYLDHGQIVVVAEVAGPIRAVDTTSYVINGRDGRTVLRCVHVDGLRWPALAGADQLTVVAPVRVLEDGVGVLAGPRS